MLWNQMLATDITAAVPELKIPAYFLHGIYDYTVAYPITISWPHSSRRP
ncbi:MAG: hypothetical protein U0X20_26530 [Caldilineaceae bacterium]